MIQPGTRVKRKGEKELGTVINESDNPLIKSYPIYVQWDRLGPEACAKDEIEMVSDGSRQREDAQAMALGFVERERQLQEQYKAEGKFKYTPADPQMHEFEKLACILEEVGEVARNCMARADLVTDGEKDNESLLKELRQVAALSVAWMEAIIKDEYFDRATGESRN